MNFLERRQYLRHFKLSSQQSTTEKCMRYRVLCNTSFTWGIQGNFFLGVTDEVCLWACLCKIIICETLISLWLIYFRPTAYRKTGKILHLGYFREISTLKLFSFLLQFSSMIFNVLQWQWSHCRINDESWIKFTDLSLEHSPTFDT